MSVKLQGGLGNQMFQAAYGLSKGCRTFDVSSFDNDTLRHYELDQYNLHIELVKDQEAEAGYWQDEKFFDTKLIRKLFELPKGMPNEACQKMAQRINRCHLDGTDSCFIGVRRADYLWPERITYHGVMPMSYYCDALERFPVEMKAFVFSDDIPWAKENLSYLENVELVDVNGPNEKAWDIWLMSLCKHAIVANSSFHWWGAWLQNDTGTVIAPKKWYADEAVNAQCTIVPERWVRI
jgi:hypothetical protein